MDEDERARIATETEWKTTMHLRIVSLEADRANLKRALWAAAGFAVMQAFPALSGILGGLLK